MVVVEAVPAGEVEPRVLRRVEVGQPAGSGVACREGGSERLLVGCSRYCFGHAELDRESGESPELVVRPPEQDVDPRDHLGDRLVGDLGPGTAAELVEIEVRPIAENEELDVVLPDQVEGLEQAVVRDKEGVARSPAATLGDDRLVFDLRQVGHRQPVELPDRLLDLPAPALVERVPVLVVVPAPPREQLLPYGERGLVSDRVGAQVDVAVQEPALDAERGRSDEQAGDRLVERDDDAVQQQSVEWSVGLRPVHAVVEPEAALVERAAILAEHGVVGIHVLPAFASRRDRDLERAGEAAVGRRWPSAGSDRTPSRFRGDGSGASGDRGPHRVG